MELVKNIIWKAKYIEIYRGFIIGQFIDLYNNEYACFIDKKSKVIGGTPARILVDSNRSLVELKKNIKKGLYCDKVDKLLKDYDTTYYIGRIKGIRGN